MLSSVRDTRHGNALESKNVSRRKQVVTLQVPWRSTDVFASKTLEQGSKRGVVAMRLV
jgi:hypothetical protein